MPPRPLSCFLAALVSLALFSVSASAASLEDPFNQWLPDSDAASWTYAWTDSQYATTPTKELYTVSGRAGAAFRLNWTTAGLGNPDDAQSTTGSVDYRRTTAGTVVT